MKHQMVSVYDRAAAAYARPMCYAALGLAIRQFNDEVNRSDQQNELYKHPEDFDLFHMGDFDDNTGKIHDFESPKKIATGVNAKTTA